jgi:hypothetical protein
VRLRRAGRASRGPLNADVRVHSMRQFLTFLIAAMFLAPHASSAADSPIRGSGISMHMLPKRVAQISGEPWGLTVSYANHLKPEPAQPVVQSASQFLTYVRKQSPSVQANGVWIVTTDPSSYSESELAMLDEIKALCRKEQIPLFVAQATELPNGWKRYDRAL